MKAPLVMRADLVIGAAAADALSCHQWSHYATFLEECHQADGGLAPSSWRCPGVCWDGLSGVLSARGDYGAGR